jgi:DNA-binding NarL/FixJ family response regulator
MRKISDSSKVSQDSENPSSFARLIIADDHELVRSSLRLMLEGEQDLQIIAEARDGQEAIELYRLHRPNLVLMDVKMPKVNGLEATRTIKEEFPTAKVLTVSAYESQALTSEAIVAGADGYVSKLCPLQELLEAIRAVLRGESVFP